MWKYYIIGMVVGYLFGCFQTAYIIGRMHHIDIREHGSGNAGTTNALRTLGKKAAILTFLGDALKGLIPVLLAKYLVQKSGLSIDASLLALVTGLFVVLGHNFPFYLKFRGGKGIATTAAVLLAFDLRFAAISFVLFMTVVLITRYVSLSSIVMVCGIPIEILVFYRDSSPWLLVVGCIFTGLAIIRHHGNIHRLLNGTESKLGEKKKEKV